LEPRTTRRSRSISRITAAAARPANERLATDPTHRSLAQLVESRDARHRDLARWQRAERDATRAFDGLGPIRRHTRGPRLALALEDAQRCTGALNAEITRLDRAIRTRQLEIAERVRARRLETPTPGRAIDPFGRCAEMAESAERFGCAVTNRPLMGDV